MPRRCKLVVVSARFQHRDSCNYFAKTWQRSCQSSTGTKVLPVSFFNIQLPANFWSSNAANYDIRTLHGIQVVPDAQHLEYLFRRPVQLRPAPLYPVWVESHFPAGQSAKRPVPACAGANAPVRAACGRAAALFCASVGAGLCATRIPEVTACAGRITPSGLRTSGRRFGPESNQTAGRSGGSVAREFRSRRRAIQPPALKPHPSTYCVVC
jgi:hypothetical protein